MIATLPKTSPADRTLRQRLAELRRRYREEEISLQAALAAAETLLARWLRELWDAAHAGETPSPFLLRRLAEEVERHVDALERDLVDVRIALRSTAEELDALASTSPALRLEPPDGRSTRGVNG